MIILSDPDEFDFSSKYTALRGPEELYSSSEEEGSLQFQSLLTLRENGTMLDPVRFCEWLYRNESSYFLPQRAERTKSQFST